MWSQDRVNGEGKGVGERGEMRYVRKVKIKNWQCIYVCVYVP